MKILVFLGKHLVPRFLQNLIKYALYHKGYTFSQVKPFHIFSLASGKTILDKTVYIHKDTVITGNITMWRYSYIRSNTVSLVASYKYSIHIWNFCSIGPGVQIYATNDHDYTKLTTYPPRATWIVMGPDFDGWSDVKIWHDVWIGANTIILPWVNIGTWSVIGAGSIVTRDVPPYAIIGWSPAKIIKYRFDENIIWKLLDSEWWNWDIDTVKNNYNLEFLENA